MRIDVLTLFPELVETYFSTSVIGRARHAGLFELHTHQLRDYSTDPHRKVDDRPFGGGPGMLLMCQPVIDAVAAIESLDPRPARRVLFTPQGRVFRQSVAREYAACRRLLLICGHYEGFDERIVDLLQPDELSLGDFVITGGEAAAMAVADATLRLLPGVLGHPESAQSESFAADRLDHPQYTRPRDFRGLSVPDVLLSGNHADIERARADAALERTRTRRADLLPDEDRTPRLLHPHRPARMPAARSACV